MSRRSEGRSVKLSRLPKGVRRAAARRLERLQQRGPAADLIYTAEWALEKAQRRESLLQYLDEGSGPLGPRIEKYAQTFGVTPRTVRRWLDRYRASPGVTVLVPQRRGPRLGQRRLSVSQENIVSDAIDAWANRTERLPLSWIV
jgi:DNA-binding transcriptional ArsR family regulator